MSLKNIWEIVFGIVQFLRLCQENSLLELIDQLFREGNGSSTIWDKGRSTSRRLHVCTIFLVIKDFASGEIKQDSSLFNSDLMLEEYLLKSYYKATSLIAASTKAAAIFSGVGSSICEQIYEYGKNLGLSFQVVDDILDYTQSAEQLGKSAGNDLAKGNLTAPLIFALEKEPKLRVIIDSEFGEDGSLDTAMRLVNKCGGIKRAQDLAKAKGDLTIQNLQCPPQCELRSSLEGMMKYNLERFE